MKVPHGAPSDDRHAALKDLANVFDGVLVLLGVVDMIISRPFTGGTVRDEDSSIFLLRDGNGDRALWTHRTSPC